MSEKCSAFGHPFFVQGTFSSSTTCLHHPSWRFPSLIPYYSATSRAAWICQVRKSHGCTWLIWFRVLFLIGANQGKAHPCSWIPTRNQLWGLGWWSFFLSRNKYLGLKIWTEKLSEVFKFSFFNLPPKKSKFTPGFSFRFGIFLDKGGFPLWPLPLWSSPAVRSWTGFRKKYSHKNYPFNAMSQDLKSVNTKVDVKVSFWSIFRSISSTSHPQQIFFIKVFFACAPPFFFMFDSCAVSRHPVIKALRTRTQPPPRPPKSRAGSGIMFWTWNKLLFEHLFQFEHSFLTTLPSREAGCPLFHLGTPSAASLECAFCELLFLRLGTCIFYFRPFFKIL